MVPIRQMDLARGVILRHEMLFKNITLLGLLSNRGSHVTFTVKFEKGNLFVSAENQLDHLVMVICFGAMYFLLDFKLQFEVSEQQIFLILKILNILSRRKF